MHEPEPEDRPSHRRSVRSVSRTLVRRGTALAVVVVVVEFLVVPRLVGATRHLDLLGRIHPGWLVTGVALEAAALVSYSLLTRTMLAPDGPGLSRLVRITLATTALEHVVPGGAVAGPALGVQLLTSSGVAAADAAFVVVTQAIWSAIVLNALLWVALLASLPVAGVRPVYLVVTILGLVALLLTATLILTFTRGEQRAVRAVRWVGSHLPRLGPDRLEAAVLRVAGSIEHLRSRALLVRGTVWAALNWLLDAAALGAFLAAFGATVSPAELFVAYGVANVLAVIPVVPAGLGIIEVSAVSLLVSFGLPAAVATFGVLAWRLVNFWLPIPVGALAYLSLRLPEGMR